MAIAPAARRTTPATVPPIIAARLTVDTGVGVALVFGVFVEGAVVDVDVGVGVGVGIGVEIEGGIDVEVGLTILTMRP